MSDHVALADCVAREAGVILHDKAYLFENRLRPIMKEFGLSTFDEIAARFRADGDLRERVLDTMTTHETRFFRDEHLFLAFTKQIIPELLSTQREDAGNGVLRIWSAGCSTGQEPYSILISILEHHPRLAGRVKILATDVSRPTLERAIQGRFSAFEVQRGMTPALLGRYFQQEGGDYVLRETYRSQVEFRIQNLVMDPVPGTFDVIFCRNVAIYFTTEERSKLFGRFAQNLRRDGVLILGGAESPTGFYDNFVRRECGLAQYYEMNMSRVTWFPKPGATK